MLATDKLQHKSDLHSHPITTVPTIANGHVNVKDYILSSDFCELGIIILLLF